MCSKSQKNQAEILIGCYDLFILFISALEEVDRVV